ncbi:MAG: hypothetical protein Ta2A_13980 [Treponemataceae bacterium]|nr:MAG: hypothetical protein Ta2A_13980 [Treponemataceae bacterium]
MMTIQQTIDIPESREVRFTLPSTVPTGRTTIALIFSAPEPVAPKKDARADGGGIAGSAAFPTIAELKAEAARKTAKRRLEGREPFEGLYGALKDSKALEGDPVEIVQRWRDGW